MMESCTFMQRKSEAYVETQQQILPSNKKPKVEKENVYNALCL
jgi:hypothetical protein